MDLFWTFVIFLIVVAAAFFAFGVLAGYYAGHKDGYREAADEMSPSYAILLAELAKVPNKYKDFGYSDNPGDEVQSR